MRQTMGKQYTTSVTRRRALSVAGAAGLARCTSGGSTNSSDEPGRQGPEVRSREVGREAWDNELDATGEDAGRAGKQIPERDIAYF